MCHQSGKPSKEGLSQGPKGQDAPRFPHLDDLILEALDHRHYVKPIGWADHRGRGSRLLAFIGRLVPGVGMRSAKSGGRERVPLGDEPLTEVLSS